MSETQCKIGVQLLDRDYNPIQNAKVKLEYCGKSDELSSGQNGRFPDILSNVGDIVKIFIARPDGSWKQITEVVSELGNKLVTLVSPKIKITAETKEHPKDSSGRPVADTPDPSRKPVTPPENPKSSSASGSDIQSSPNGGQNGIGTKPGTAKNGAPTVVVSIDQVAFDCFDQFTEEPITDADFKWAATELGVEEAVIRAFNEVEAAGKGFMMLNKRNLPKILFERHYFHRITKGEFTAANPDISWKQGYYIQGVQYVPDTFSCIGNDGKTQTFKTWRVYREKKDATLKKQIKTGKSLFNSGAITKEKDAYGMSYKRLAKAYAINKEAALKSCSWGAFQIMGEHCGKMKYASATAFVKAMSRSEREHIRAFVLFCKHVNPKIIKDMKAKNFESIAKRYNGADYKLLGYDKKLQSSYDKWRKK